jgi:hypothetical protein
MFIRIFPRRIFLSAALLLSLITSSIVIPQSIAEAANYQVFQDQAAFYAELVPNTIKVVDFDYYPDGSPVPTGYDPAGNWSGFVFAGDEWSSLGVIFSTPSGQPMSTVNITEWPLHGDYHYNFSSPPNSLTPGQPPYVGYGVPHSPNTGDPLYIVLDPPRWAVGLVFVDNSPIGYTEHVEFRAANGSIIADLPSPQTGYLSFLGIVSDTPIASIQVFEEMYDGDDVAYDDIAYGIPIGQVIESTTDIKPETLNKTSEGNWVTSYIELPNGFDVADIDISTVMLDSTIPAEVYPTEIGDYDTDSIPDLMVKFSRQALIQHLIAVTGGVIVMVRGELINGEPFEGSDTINLIQPK